MKINTSKKQSWKTILAVAITGVVSGMVGSNAVAEDVFIENHSFEDTTDLASFSGGRFMLGTPLGWDLHISTAANAFTFGFTEDYTDGSVLLDLNDPNDTLFNEAAPDGERVLLLMTTQAWETTTQTLVGDIIVEFGVEQPLDIVLEALHSYTLRVNVGDPEGGSFDSNFPVDGFPGYKVQLIAEGTFDEPEVVIAEDDSTLSIEEGYFVLSELAFDVGSTHELLGRDLLIRLINKNEPVDGPGIPVNNNLEVNFDNVRLDVTPIRYGINHVYPVEPELRWLPGSNPGLPNDRQIEQFFSITGKGKKRVLLTGRGPSFNERLTNVIEDPTVVVLDEKGNVVARSDDWLKERDASEIKKILGREKTHRSDAGVIVELPAGDYSVVVKPKGKESGYASSEIYDLDPKSTAVLKFSSAAEKELRKIWK